MATVLTAKAVENSKPNPEKRIEKPDAALPGLYLVIQPSGARSWALRYRKEGTPAKLTIGPVLDRRDEAAPNSATRAGAHAHRGPYSGKGCIAGTGRGQGPWERRRAAQAAAKANPERDSIRMLSASFIDRYCKPRNRAWAEVERQFKVEINPKWGDRRAQEIGKRDVLDLLDRIVDRGSPVSKSRLRHLAAFLWVARGARRAQGLALHRHEAAGSGNVSRPHPH